MLSFTFGQNWPTLQRGLSVIAELLVLNFVSGPKIKRINRTDDQSYQPVDANRDQDQIHRRS